MTFFAILPPKDRTAAARQRRFRQNRKARVRALQEAPAAEPGETVSLMKAEMYGLAQGLIRGEADRRDMRMAAALIIRLSRFVPANGEVLITLAH